MTLEFKIGYKKEGRNSVLLETSEGHVFYEKLSNTIHSGKENELKSLQEKVESVEYNPAFESESLKNGKGKPLEGLVLNVTESCNLGCAYCIYSGKYQNERKNNPKKMNIETAVKAVNLFMDKTKNPALISFYGGEPLNNMEMIKEVIDYTKNKFSDKTVLYSMTSNFYDADKHIPEIVDNDIQVLISLDGPKEVHDKYRRTVSGKPTWEKIISNMKKMEEYSPGYVKRNIGQSVTCADSNDAAKIINFFRDEKYFNVYRIGGVEIKGLKDDIDKKDNTSLIHHLAGEFLEKAKSNEKIPGVVNILFDQKLRLLSKRDMQKMPKTIMLSGACYPGNRKLFVDTEGELYMCEKFGKRMPIGHIDKGLDYNLINESIDRFSEIRNDVCTNNCWAQRVCMPCIQTAKDFGNEISEQGLAQTCENSKKDLLISLSLHSAISKANEGFMARYNETQMQGGKNERNL